VCARALSYAGIFVLTLFPAAIKRFPTYFGWVPEGYRPASATNLHANVEDAHGKRAIWNRLTGVRSRITQRLRTRPRLHRSGGAAGGDAASGEASCGGARSVDAFRPGRATGDVVAHRSSAAVETVSADVDDESSRSVRFAGSIQHSGQRSSGAPSGGAVARAPTISEESPESGESEEGARSEKV